MNFGTERYTTVPVRESPDVQRLIGVTLIRHRYGTPEGHPQQTVTIPLVVTHVGGATEEDHTEIPASVLAFASPPNFEDAMDADGNNAYVVVVRATNAEGTGGWSESASGSPDADATPLSFEESELPESVRLGQNYPNPFNPSTTIEYALPRPSKVHLAVYDLFGHRVAVLTDGVRQAGPHAVRFDASGLSSGTYVYRLVAEKQVLTGHMSLVK